MTILQSGATKSLAASYDIDNSLRFDDGDSAFLQKAYASSGNRRTWTFSCWTKRGEIDQQNDGLLSCDFGTRVSSIGFIGTGTGILQMYDHTFSGGSYQTRVASSAVYRDPSAWYHIVVKYDTTEVTDTDRVKLYINGEEITDLSQTTYPAQDYEGNMNYGNGSRLTGIGKQTGTADYYDGYIAEAYFIDGTALTPSSFGELSSTTNQWIPLDSDDVKDAVNFGTNGFYQKYNSTELAASFADSAEGGFKPSANISADILIVGGGGGGGRGGGAAGGGGGGAGGFKYFSQKSLTADTIYSVVIGQPGEYQSDSVADYSTLSSFGSDEALPGMGGKIQHNPSPGGSGGGGNYAYTAGGAGTANQGNDGGDGHNSGVPGDFKRAGGGGGGAKNAGGDGSAGSAGAGGDGYSTGDTVYDWNLADGTTVTFPAGFTDGSSVTSYAGGGGGTRHGSVAGAGGTGGGGAGYAAGIANTGGGGGAGDDASTVGQEGGSGIVIVRYQANSAQATGGTITNYGSGASEYYVHTFLASSLNPRNTITANGDATNQRPQPHTVTANGDAHLIGSKQGTSVINFDGTGDYLSLADSSDWDLYGSAGSSTLEFWVNHTTTSGSQGYIAQYEDGSNRWWLAHESGSGMQFEVTSGGSGIVDSGWVAGAELSANRWYHVAVVKNGNDYNLYVDGVSKWSVTDSSTDTFAGPLYIGYLDAGSTYPLKGNIDCLRLSDSARYTADFTPPTTAFTDDSDTVLLIKNGTDGTQTFTDDNSSGRSAHTITANGDVRWFAPKVGAGAMAFDGTGDYFSVPDSSSFDIGDGQFTIESWVKFNSVSSQQIISQYDYGSSQRSWVLTSAGTALEFTYSSTGGSGPSQMTGSWTPSADTWYHVAISRDSSDDVRMFIDGTQIGVTTSISTVLHNSTANLTVGTYLNSGSSGSTPLNGYMDMTRVSRVARYTSSFDEPTTAFTDDINTVLLLNADINQGTWAEDTSTGLAISTDSRMKFDGTGDYLSVPDSSDWDFGSDAWTMEFWFNANAATHTGIFALGPSAGNIAVSVYQSTSSLDVHVSSDGTNWDIQTGTINDNLVGSWNHLAIVFTGSAYLNFLNGVLKKTTTSSTAIYNGDHTIYLGRDASSNYLNGYIDEIRISDSARYTGAFTPQTRGNPFTADANTLLLIHSDYTGGLGADSSGNYNNFTATNLVATDQMIDTPTNNFATFNGISYGDNGGNFELREGNLQAYMTSGVGKTHSTFSLFDDGCYWEMMVGDTGGGYGIALMKNNNLTTSSQLGADSYSEIAYRPSTGNLDIDGSTDATYATASAGDILNFAFKSGRLYVGKNNTWFNSGAPASGTGYVNSSAVTGDWCAACSLGANSPNYGSINFGADSSFAGKTTAQGNQDGNEKGDFYYTPPSGFLALCEDNLSTPEIKLPGEYFNTVLWSGSGGARDFTGVGFQPDFLWGKARDDTWEHLLIDSVRGSNETLYSNSTNEQSTDDSHGYVDSLDADGWSVVEGSSSANQWNDATDTFVAWNWKAGGAPTATNSAGAGAVPTAGSVKIDGSNLGSALAGSIAATKLSANTTAGFSIVEYVGNQTSGDTIAHGLSVAPQMIFIKSMDDVDQWSVYSEPVGNTKTLYLNLNNDASAASAGFWNNTTPSSTIFTLGNETQLNKSGSDYIAYCFHNIEGYSKVGSYTGNGNADGPFVYTGFKPKFVIVKNADLDDDWEIYDGTFNPYNYLDLGLKPNTGGAEYALNSNNRAWDFVSNGFKVRGSNGGINQSGDDLIYIAFAESPFKTSNAR